MSRSIRSGALIAATAVVAACGGSDDFTRGDAVQMVLDETGATDSEASCVVDGVLDRGLQPSDFDSHDPDPRFAATFERVVTQCLLIEAAP